MPRRKQFVREEVLERAMHVFWRKGYESAGVRDLVEGMGINRFSLYDSFGSKENLFLESLRLYRETFIRANLNILRDSPEGLESIRKVFMDFIRFVKNDSANGCLMINTVAENANDGENLRRLCRDYLRDLERAFAMALERSRALGEVSSDIDLRGKAKFLTGSMQGLGILVKIASRRDLEIYVDNVMSAL